MSLPPTYYESGPLFVYLRGLLVLIVRIGNFVGIVSEVLSNN